jgi:hypothetical protein
VLPAEFPNPGAEAGEWIGKKWQKKDEAAVKHFEPDVAIPLLDRAADDYPRRCAFLATGMLGGLRWGESVALQAGGIKWDGGVIRVQRQQARAGGWCRRPFVVSADGGARQAFRLLGPSLTPPPHRLQFLLLLQARPRTAHQLAAHQPLLRPQLADTSEEGQPSRHSEQGSASPVSWIWRRGWGARLGAIDALRVTAHRAPLVTSGHLRARRRLLLRSSPRFTRR